MTTISNLNVQMLEHTRIIEANQANVHEFHLSGIIDMLGKLQKKKLDAELHDAQEDENNAADPIFFNSVRGTLWCLVPDGAVQEELEFMRQLKVYHEVPANLVLKSKSGIGTPGSRSARGPSRRSSRVSWVSTSS